MYPSTIDAIHIELTDKCQAACPMCARNYNGGIERPFIKNKEIYFTDFKKWFPKSFLQNINNFYSCGNYGDPVFARDCFEIYSYVREISPNARLAIHTNGSLRNQSWWENLAKVMGNNGEVIFAVDGFKGKHELYRRNTSFEKIIENITTYVNSGGTARVDSLVFSHNEDDVEELKNFLLNLGVKSVNFKGTKRFYNLDMLPVYNNKNELEYNLYPTTKLEFKPEVKIPMEKFLSNKFLENVLENATVIPQCVEKREIFVDPQGNVFPCCYVGSDYVEEPLEEKIILHKLRNISVLDTKKMLQDIGVPNLNLSNIVEILEQNIWTDINNYWQGKNKCMTCVKNCSTQLYS
jgi:MoaA/NifB/PqqE/SkfB family radical SAM enzyme